MARRCEICGKGPLVGNTVSHANNKNKTRSLPNLRSVRVKLDGEVGVLGNGAGLTMSTVDVVTFVGGRPANFCDLGGGGDARGVVDALEVITRDPQVRAIFFNVFGGITRCDEVARGILQAVEQMGIEEPIVVRLDGTNAEEGRRILRDSGIQNLHAEATMLDGARRAVELAQ